MNDFLKRLRKDIIAKVNKRYGLYKFTFLARQGLRKVARSMKGLV